MITRRQFVKLSAALPAVPYLLTQTACTTSELTHFQNEALIVLASSKGIQKTLNDLIEQGKIVGAFAEWIKQKLPPGIDLVSQLNDKIQVLTKWPPANKQEIIDFVDSVIKFIEDAQAEGLLKFGPSNVVSSVTSALAVIDGLLTTIKSALDGSVAAPAALKQLKGATSELRRIDGELKQMGVE